MKTESSDARLRPRLLVAVVTPILLLLLVGGLLTTQIFRMSETAHWVDRTDEALSRINKMHRQIIDQESAVRGYMLSEDASFLEPFDRARPLEDFEALKSAVEESQVQRGRLAEARAVYEAWLVLSEPIAHGRTSLSEARNINALRARKRRMDALRTALAELVRGEELLRNERSAASDASTRTTLWTGGVLFLVIGAALAFAARRQIGSLASTYDGMLTAERDTRQALEAEGWLRARQMALAEKIRGDKSVEDFATIAIETFATETGAAVGAFYVAEAGGWHRRGGYALDGGAPKLFADGEGLVGQVGRDKKTAHLANAPADLLRVRSGAADRKAVDLLIGAAQADGDAEAVIELGFLEKPSQRALDLVERAGGLVAVAIRSAKYRARLKELLEESQQQSEELQAQQEELRVANEELQQQGEALRGAHAQLEERKEELEASNAGLEAQRNALERAQRDLAEKAADLARASQYKSEFLANMSHELRTPLNSTLILAKLLSDNEANNLTPEQVRYAQTISSAGNDLLALINDILDLAKIEAGKVDVNATKTTVGQLLEPVTRTFEPVANDKGLAFEVTIDDGARALETDVQRAQQIVKNLLSNAFKFTEKGKVSLGVRLDGENVVLAVTDTGIGIPKEHHAAVFEAFRQADGTTNRRFGGTGLGLSISRDLAKLLGGTLRMESEPGKGSKFTLVLPLVVPAPRQGGEVRVSLHAPAPLRGQRVPPSTNGGGNGARTDRVGASAHVRDDRDALDPRQRILLAVEDDTTFADVLATLARQLEFQFLHATTSEDGVRLALQHLPTAIVLDVGLPDHSGLSVLDRLKREPATRHIPVHVVSAADHTQAALTMGAAGYLLKPVNRDELVAVLKKLGERFDRVRRLLVVEDDEVQRNAIQRLLGADEIEIVAVSTVAAALEQLGQTTFDCVVTDLSLPDASGYELLEKMAADERYSFPPVIVYTGRSLSADEEQRLRRYSSSIIVKGARSPERLLDEVTLFLHQVEASLPAERQRMLRQARDREVVFAGKKILIAEDDVRNVFALTSVLEPKGATVLLARNGREAVTAAEKHDDLDLVLMDIMMPEMDGLTAMQEIRKRGGRLAKLPIIALTAKVMKDDQERCLAAGANDYIAKPIDVEMLLSLARVWMHA